MFGCFEGKGSSIYEGNVDKTEKVSTMYQNNGQCSCSNNVHIQIDYDNICFYSIFFIPRSIRKKMGFLIF